MNKFKTLSSGLLLAAVLGLSNQAQALTIDTFDQTAQTLSSSTPGDFSSVNTAPGEVIDNNRVLTIVSVSPGGATPTISVDSVLTPNALSVAHDPGESSVTSVTWGLAGGLGGLDLTDGGVSNALLIDIGFIDTNVNITFKVKETNNQPGTGTPNIGDTATLTLNNLGVGVSTFLFSSFTNFNIVNFESVGRIVMEINGGIGSDLVLNLVETNELPEPSSLVLMGLGLAGFSFLRKRKSA